MNKLTRLSLMAVLLFAAGAIEAQVATSAQVKEPKKTSADQGAIDRGRYIVEGVAMCEQCHTRRDEHGNPVRDNWLQGGPTQLQPSYPSPTWAVQEPRIAGAPPGTDEQFITLLTTGISRTGSPPNPPMPPFRMTRTDAEAVLAYLKSLR